MSGAEVLSQGTRVVELCQSGAGDEEILGAIERYCELFSDWEGRQARASAQGDLWKEFGADEGLVLAVAEVNERIHDIIAEYRRDTSKALADTLRMSKAVRAYVDVFPQRVSVRRPQKG